MFFVLPRAWTNRKHTKKPDHSRVSGGCLQRLLGMGGSGHGGEQRTVHQPSLWVQVSVQKEGNLATWANTDLDVNTVLSVLCL